MQAPALTDARESLSYWEERARCLPRHALRRRREAREMAHRWRARVAEAERERYGRGLLGAALLLLEERRLPQTTVHRARSLVRRTVQAVAVAAFGFALAVLATFVAVVEAIF